MMSNSLHAVRVRRSVRFGLVAAALLPVLCVLESAAALVSTLGLDRAFATGIVKVLISQGPEVLAAVFPWLRPLVGVLQWLLNFGAEYAISF